MTSIGNSDCFSNLPECYGVIRHQCECLGTLWNTLRHVAATSRALASPMLHLKEMKDQLTRGERISVFFQDFQGFSEIFENHVFFMKNKSCQIGSGVFLGHPGHAYARKSDSQTPRGHSARASSGGGRM